MVDPVRKHSKKHSTAECPRRCRGWGSSRPPLHAAGDSACGPPQVFFGGGGPIPLCLTASVVRGAFFLLDHGAVSVAGAEGGPLEGTGYGGRRQPLWTRVGPFSRITSATAPARGTLRSRGGPLPAVRLGWRLAARTGADQGNPTV
ncbi:unnamed protein product [Pleuronectes platessa]|uniref:Uncharacterized protein n=1 Tax=Pleuronectes platessa TaxID=8262 RepID=A0A9N7V361_PLEPL|nr:unnamed protein product [Pleuronectes platessa]